MVKDGQKGGQNWSGHKTPIQPARSSRAGGGPVPITPVKTTKLYLLIIDQLKQMILRGEFNPGDRLPAERELAQLLRVSRAPVREALVALELLDIVQGRVGEGWFVKRPPDAALDVTAVQGRPPSDILQARLLIECAVIEEVARRRDADELSMLRTAVDAFQAEVGAGQYRGEADRTFHLGLTQAAGNSVFTDLVAYLWDLQNGQFFRRVEGMIGNLPARVERYVTEHQDMLVAIAARDAAGARDRMRRHLEGVYQDLLDS